MLCPCYWDPGHLQPLCPPRTAGKEFPHPSSRVPPRPGVLSRAVPARSCLFPRGRQGAPQAGPSGPGTADWPAAAGREAATCRKEQLPAPPSLERLSGNRISGRPAALRRLASCPSDLGLPGGALPHAAARNPALAEDVPFQPPPTLYHRGDTRHQHAVSGATSNPQAACPFLLPGAPERRREAASRRLASLRVLSFLGSHPATVRARKRRAVGWGRL